MSTVVARYFFTTHAVSLNPAVIPVAYLKPPVANGDSSIMNSAFMGTLDQSMWFKLN